MLNNRADEINNTKVRNVTKAVLHDNNIIMETKFQDIRDELEYLRTPVERKI